MEKAVRDANSGSRYKLSGGGIAYSETHFSLGTPITVTMRCSPSLIMNWPCGTIMGMGWGGEEQGLDLNRLDPEAAAEYFWRRFASRLR